MIQLQYEDKNLKLLKDGKCIYNIHDGVELLHAGYGKNDFSMTRGSFTIKETTYVDKPLKVKKIKLNDNVAEIVLNEGIVILSAVGNRLNAEINGLDAYNRMIFTLPATENEHIYGTGETFSEFDLRGQKVNVWVAEHQNAKMISKKYLKIKLGLSFADKKQKFSNYETYYAQPTFLSSRKYYFHSQTTSRCEFDFTNPAFHKLKIDSIDNFTIGFGDSFEQVIEDLSLLLGRQPELPDWVYDGAILGIQGGTDIMLSKVNNCLEHGMKVNGVWIQDWEGRRVTAFGKQLMWNWVWDKELYPDLDKAIVDLHARGIKFLGYINPFLAIEKELYKEAAEKGYCVKDADGNDYLVKITTFPAAMIDLTNPDAYEWIKNIIKENMIGLGLDGWMADFSEYLPTDCVLSNGMDAKDIHNTWPELWAKVNREALEETGKLGEVLFFTRAGHTNTVKYSTLMWNGDQHVDFSYDDGLPSVIPATLSLAVSGFGLCHSDIGGYTTFGKMRRNEELFMRWSELNVFTPLFRGHEGNQPDNNVQFDKNEAVLRHYAKMSRIHYGLKDYIKSLVIENSQYGVPVNRPLFYYYEKEKDFSETYEFMLGRDLLIAPVLEEGDDKRSVYLPDDEWVNLWNGYELVGGTYNVDAPLGEPPVFCRKSSPYLEQFKSLFNSEKNN
jgi:alpha-glucosidase